MIERIVDKIVYCATDGRVKPRNHVLLGIGVKYITGSKQLLNVLNRNGDAISYSAVENIQNEWAEEIREMNTQCPEGMLEEQCLCTNIFFLLYHLEI